MRAHSFTCVAIVLLAAACATASAGEGTTRNIDAVALVHSSRILRDVPQLPPPVVDDSGDGPPGRAAGAGPAAAESGLEATAERGGTPTADRPPSPELVLKVRANPDNPGVVLKIKPGPISSSSSRNTPPGDNVVSKQDTPGSGLTDAAVASAAAAAAALPANTSSTPTPTSSSSSPQQQSPPSLAMMAANSGMFTSGEGSYMYLPHNSASNVPLGMPVSEAPGGLHMPRWVMCAWSVSNFSSPVMLSEDVMREVQNMINNFTSMAPGQVQLAAHANVTLALRLSDLPPGTAADEALVTRVMQLAASQWAGGYNSAYIDVAYSQPDYGVPSGEFQAAGQQTVVQKSVATAMLPHRDGDMNSNGSKFSNNRRMLRQSSSAPAAAAAGSGERLVWVSYTRMTPLNATALQSRVADACGVDKLTGGLTLDGTLCADVLSQLLRDSGVELGQEGVGLATTDAPVVSLAIRLAVGVTEAQAAAGTDTLLATWLAQPRNIRSAIAISGVPDPIGPSAIIKWLLPPEIWVAPPPSVNPLSNPANAVGVALGAAAFVVLLAAATAWLVVARRRRRRAAALESDKHHGDAASTASSRRRRRRHGKRRYLLPEAPAPPDPSAATSSAAAMAAAAAMGGAGGAGSSSSGIGAAVGGDDDDTLMTPDQIRPAMRELGDSVTSAVRFEDEEEGEGEGEQQGNDDGQQQQQERGPRNSREAAAAAVAAGGASSAQQQQQQQQRVLLAREALLAERQQQQQGSSVVVEMAALGATATAGAAGAAGAAGVVAGCSAAAHRSHPMMDSPFGSPKAQEVNQQQQQQQQQLPLPQQPLMPQQPHRGSSSLQPAGLNSTATATAVSSSASSGSRAVSLESQGRPFRTSTLSPFAVGYNFADLADAAAAAAAATTATASADADAGVAAAAAGPTQPPLSSNSNEALLVAPPTAVATSAAVAASRVVPLSSYADSQQAHTQHLQPQQPQHLHLGQQQVEEEWGNSSSSSSFSSSGGHVGDVGVGGARMQRVSSSDDAGCHSSSRPCSSEEEVVGGGGATGAVGGNLKGPVAAHAQCVVAAEGRESGKAPAAAQ